MGRRAESAFAVECALIAAASCIETNDARNRHLHSLASSSQLGFTEGRLRSSMVDGSTSTRHWHNNRQQGAKTAASALFIRGGRERAVLGRHSRAHSVGRRWIYGPEQGATAGASGDGGGTDDTDERGTIDNGDEGSVPRPNDVA